MERIIIMKFYHAFDKKTLEYKGTLEWITGRIPWDHFIPTDSPEEIKIPENKKCVFVEESKKFEFVSIKEFKELQITLGNDDPLEDSQKLNEEGERISKTDDELLNEGFFTREQLIEKVKLKTNQKFLNLLKRGIIFKGHRFDCSDASKTRVADAILESQTFPDDFTNVWVSECKVDEDGNDIEGTENAYFPIASINDLLALGKEIKDFWKLCFFERRKVLDSLTIKTDSELVDLLKE
jgi:hypothetical protein